MASNARHLVIDFSVTVESYVSTILAQLLGIDLENSRTLGNKSEGFSFEARINLLIDLKYLSEDERTKLKTFAQIRNKFAHCADAIDFSSCFSFINGTENYLKKHYGDKTVSTDTEIERTKWFFSLFHDVFIIVEKLLNHIVEKTANDTSNKLDKEFLDSIVETFDEKMLRKDSEAEVIQKFYTASYKRFKEKQPIDKQKLL